MSGSWLELESKLDRLAKDFAGVDGRRDMAEIGLRLKGEVDRAAERELGSDRSMSGWSRSKPIEITGTFRPRNSSVVIFARGGQVMRVLESGRHMGDSDLILGPGVNRKTGVTARTKGGKVRKVRATRSRRWNGYTQPKNTWTEATTAIAARGPGVAHSVKVDKAMSRLFSKGG